MGAEQGGLELDNFLREFTRIPTPAFSGQGKNPNLPQRIDLVKAQSG